MDFEAAVALTLYTPADSDLVCVSELAWLTPIVMGVVYGAATVEAV